jgi:hypothetical protein
LVKYEPVAAALGNQALLGGFYARKAQCEWHFARFVSANLKMP